MTAYAESTTEAPVAPAPEPAANGDLVAFLEPDQLTADTSVPVPRAALSARARAGLWALRIFVTVVGAMVVYAFVAQFG
jgi:hypothetical protein